jgi:protein-disulfide isomerase
MRSRLSVAAIGFAVVGLGASVASLIDYFAISPTFCAETGCATVRESAWAHPLGIPMPVLGIVFYLAALALCFVDAPRLRRTLAVAGAAGGLGLIGLQAFVIGAWCKLCLIADPAAIGYAVCVLAGAATLRLTVARGLATVPALCAAIGVLALWSHSPPPTEPAPTAPVPTASALPPGARMPPGTPAFVVSAQDPQAATIVEVVDFECPHCRRMQQKLSAAIEKVAKPVRIVRKMLPLPFHPHAMAAALAYCCADAQGKGEEMAAALFATDPDELTPEGCEKLATRVGCDPERYRREMPAAQKRVVAEMTEMRAARISLLPTVFIGGERIVGAGNSTEELVAMIQVTAR